MIAESDLESEFENQFSKLISSEKLQNNLIINLKKLAKTSATEAIVDEVEILLST